MVLTITLLNKISKAITTLVETLYAQDPLIEWSALR